MKKLIEKKFGVFRINEGMFKTLLKALFINDKPIDWAKMKDSNLSDEGLAVKRAVQHFEEKGKKEAAKRGMTQDEYIKSTFWPDFEP